MPTAIRSPDEARVRLDLDAMCHTCQHRHRLGRSLQDFTAEMWEWEVKHRGHDFEFLSPRRQLPLHFDDKVYEQAGDAPWWLLYTENANVKVSYAASAAFTTALASLASDTNLLAGHESTALDNTSNLYIDGRITARLTVGTSPTVDRELRIYGYASLDDTPTYPDTLTGISGNRTLTNAYMLDSGLILIGATAMSATSNLTYPIRCLTVAEAFGLHPKRLGVFVVHNAVAALHATSPNIISYIGAYITSA